VTKKDISKKRASFVNLLFNYANTLFSIINGVVLLPLYLRYFTLETYGSYLSSGNIVAMLGVLEGGMGLVLTQNLSKISAKKDFKLFTQAIGSGMIISLVALILIIFIAALLTPFIPQWVKSLPEETNNIRIAFMLSAFATGFSFIYVNISTAFQAWLKVEVPGIANLISVIIGIGTTILGLVYGMGISSIPLGLLSKSVTGTGILYTCLFVELKKKQYPKISFDKMVFRDLLKSCIPMFSGSLFKSLVDNSQLLIITNYISPRISAIFVLTGKVFQVCGIILAPIGSSIFSSVAHIVGLHDYKKLKKNIVGIYVVFTSIATIIIATGLSLNHSFISLWLGEDKFGGITLSVLLAITAFFESKFLFLNFNLYAFGIFGKTVLIDIGSAIVRLIIIFAFIKTGGVIIIPIAQLMVQFFIYSVFVNYLMKKSLSLNNKESFEFIITGMLSFIFSIFMACLCEYYIPKPSNWFILVLYAIILTLTLFLIQLIIEKKNISFIKSVFINR
jgi:O-antigen/teichoic acid export membrane protein